MIKARQKLGKYRIENKLGEGGFAAVYRATDTVEGIRVALKIPFSHLLTDDVLEDFRREIRLAAQLKHPNILPLKNADYIDGKLVIAFPLGERTLADRIQSRMSFQAALSYAEQLLDAVAYAHTQCIIHCDIKPENLILFPGNRLLLTDFGIAKVAWHTIRASGSGTVGFIAPEQAMGKPSFRSDVFSSGLILYRMLSGQLPEWPYEWPPPGFSRVRKRLHPDLIELVRRSIVFDPRKRYRDAGQMLAVLRRIKPRVLRHREPSVGASRERSKGPGRDWRTVRHRQFMRQFGTQLGTSHECSRCRGPVSESMHWCPWCGHRRRVFDQVTTFPQCCPRCHRGMKLDWEYCPWCYGPGFEVSSPREYSDARYSGQCSNRGCSRKQLMPFMKYCPWCHRKVRRKWPITGSKETCSGCGWGLAEAYWAWCPWCGKPKTNR